jgi:hypothetical protein
MPSTRPRIDLSELPPIPSREPLLLSPRKLPRRILRHPWTDDELNLICYLKVYHSWTWDRIRRTYLPSMTKSAISNAYTRISIEDRVYRASVAASLTNSDTSSLGISYSEALIRATSRKRKPQHRSHSERNAARQRRNHTTTDRLFPSTIDNESRPTIHNSTTTRYNLRPKRPRNFEEHWSQDQVDRQRFPHFFEACEDLARGRTTPDSDYVPPSHSPTPHPADRSPSVVSSQLSDVSSLELFGLEVRPLSPLDRSSPITPSSPSDEFFSAEEHPVSP